MKLSKLAAATGARIDGESSDVEISGAAGLDDAEPGQITFLANPRYTPRVKITRASAIYVNEGAQIDRSDLIVVRAPDAYLAYTRALRLFHREPTFTPLIHPTAVIDPTAKVAPEASVGACVVVGPRAQIGAAVRILPNVTIYEDVAIGRSSVIHAGAVIRERSRIGERVIIHNNCVIGCDGFGFAKDEERHWLKIPQTGQVIIENDVEIGAGTTIDRPSVGVTRIGRGTKIDNLVQIGHSCTVGEDVLLCSQVGLAGTTHIGNRAVLTGQVGVAGHLSLGDDVVVTAKSGIGKDFPAKTVVSGIPAVENLLWRKATAAFRRLPELRAKIRELEEKIQELDKQKRE